MFRHIKSVGTSNINEHVLTSENNSDAKCAVDLKIERESDDEVEFEIDLDHAIKEEMDAEPEGTSSRRDIAKQPCQNQNNYENNGSIITIEIEPMPAVKQEPTEEQELYADHETKCDMVIGPVVLQAASYVMEKNCTRNVPKKPKLETLDEDTDHTKKSKEIGTDKENTTNVDLNKNTHGDIRTDETVMIKRGRSTNKKKVLIKDNGISPRPSYNVFTCNDCGENFTRKFKLVRHIASHEKIKHKIYFKCKECTYQTVTQESLERHKKLHDKSRRIACDVCGYRFRNKDILRGHIKSVHADRTMHDCGICGYKTKHIGNLNIHKRVHTNEKPYSCTMCEYRCNQKGSLKTHLRIHSGVKPYVCTVCEKRFTETCGLTEHLRTHTGEKPYSCTMCEYKCSRQSNLARHVRTHSGEKPFACSLCMFKCKEKTTLKAHIRVHTGEKPFVCSFCDYKCNQKTVLIVHLRMHTGEKPYSCTVCEYKCNKKSILTKHFRIHSGIKPYSCTVCEYKSAHKSALNRHMRIHE